MVFNPNLDSIVINPKDPFIDETVIIETFWSNDGKRDGTIEINLYELKDDNNWRTETATVELELLAETSSNHAVFEWTPGKEGQPVLYIIIDGDLDNPAYPVNGILVKQPEEEGSGPDAGVTYGLMGAVVLMALALVGFFVMRSRGEDDYYYEDEDDSYFEEETWEYGEEAASDEESDEED
jgi:hypothetical protein